MTAALVTRPLDSEVLHMPGCPCGGSCACHGGNGAFPTPCSVPGGCGSTRTSGCSCGRPVGDDAFLCQRCTKKLAEDLQTLGPASTEVPAAERWARDYDEGGRQVRDDTGQLVPVSFGRGATTRWDTPTGPGGLLDHLELTATRQARIAPGSGGGEQPVAFHARASEVRGHLDQQLRPWALWLAGQLPPVKVPACGNPRHADPAVCCIPCRHLQRAAAHATTRRRERAIHRLASAPVAGVVAFLAGHLEVIRHHRDAGELADAVHKAVTTVKKVIDRPGSQRYGGECGAELAGGALCPTRLYAEDGESHFECPTCGTQWRVEERQAWLREFTADELATAPVIASAFSTSEDRLDVKRIHQWDTRGLLVPRGRLPSQACNAHRSKHTRPVEGCDDCSKKRGQPLYRVGDVDQLLTKHAERKASAAERRAKKGLNS